MTKRSKENRLPQVLELTPSGDESLRRPCRRLTKEEILSSNIQNLIDDIVKTAKDKKMGVGLSANQVGEPVAISVINIKPTPARPNLETFDNVCVNTEIIETFGDPEPMWEGCLSTAMDENGEPSMAKVPRFTKICIKYIDRNGNEHEEVIESFVAHVVQHETDHLNGVLFTDKIDPNDLITYQEYIKRQP